MEFKFKDYRYTFEGNFAYAAGCIKHALELMGHTEWEEPYYEAKTDSALNDGYTSFPELHIYNHCHKSELNTPNNIIFKPTAPTSQHFQICRKGYANSSEITFDEPFEYQIRKYDITEQKYVQDLIERRANKWDDSIMLKWKDSQNIPDDHILIIGQMPEDETVDGFGFGDHIKKLSMIVDKLKNQNLVIKIHPRYKNKNLINKWKEEGHLVITGYESIHSILPKTKVAITENSTAGIECMMHDVPIISYGYPDYHWITKDLRILTEINNYVDDLSWFDIENSRKFLYWYIFDYLCYDINSTVNRLQQLI